MDHATAPGIGGCAPVAMSDDEMLDCFGIDPGSDPATRVRLDAIIEERNAAIRRGVE